jgi:hypothetical protein
MVREIAIAIVKRNCRKARTAMVASQQYDVETIAVTRRALDDVFTDPRFLGRRSTSALQIAEHLLAQAATGERDLDRLKASALNELESQ